MCGICENDWKNETTRNRKLQRNALIQCEQIYLFYILHLFGFSQKKRFFDFLVYLFYEIDFMNLYLRWLIRETSKHTARVALIYII